MEEQPEAQGSGVRHSLRLLLAGLALGIAFDLLFNGKLPGISVPIFAILVLVGLALALRWEGARPLAANVWLPLTLLFFAAWTAVRANGFLTFLNVCACLGLLGLIAVHLAQSSAARTGLVPLALSPLQAVVGSVGRGGQVLGQGARPLAANGPARQRATPILRGALLAIPILLLFTALLASADLIFADRLQHILSPEFARVVGRWTGHLLISVLVGFLLAGGLAYAVRRWKLDWVDTVSSIRLPRFPSITEASVVINAVNILFLLFVLIQIPYLFGGQVNIVPAKFTYADYARRGFGELVAVAILALGLLVLLRALARRESKRQKLGFNLPATILLGLTCVVLASAFKRLLLYEQAYGFTQMRIYPHVFMVWLALLLAWFAITLWLRRDLLAIGLLVAAMGFVATLDVLNPDAFLVRQNLQMAQPWQPESGPPTRFIDAYYFEGLSADAVPALIAASEQLTDKRGEEIDQGLRARLDAMRQGTTWRKWPSYHLARDRAFRLLMERYGGGETTGP
jgi:hypothetical protein